MGLRKGKWGTWVLMAGLIHRLKAAKQKMRRNIKGDYKRLQEKIPLLVDQSYSSSNLCFKDAADKVLFKREIQPSLMRDSAYQAKSTLIKSGHYVKKDAASFTSPALVAPCSQNPALKSAAIEEDVPSSIDSGHIKPDAKIASNASTMPKLPAANTIFRTVTPTETMSQYSTDSAQSTLAEELGKLGHFLEPENPFRTAAVLRDAVVGLGTLTRRLNGLIDEDPAVANCPADVEMLVRRAGELYSSLQEFATSKGIPVAGETPTKRGKCQSNPELFFEDDAPWLDCRIMSDVSHNTYASSECGQSPLKRQDLNRYFSKELGVRAGEV